MKRSTKEEHRCSHATIGTTVQDTQVERIIRRSRVTSGGGARASDAAKYMADALFVVERERELSNQECHVIRVGGGEREK